MSKKKIDLYHLSLRIPHRRTRRYVNDLVDRWSNFFSVLGDAWFDVGFKKRHRPGAKKQGECACGFKYDPFRDKEYYNHLQQARDAEWDKRWS